MRILSIITCLSTAAMLTACMANDGHYDSRGNYIMPSNSANQGNYSGSTGDFSQGYNHSRDFSYDRAGYYDYNGYYITENSSLNVPEGMSPPRGKCRVWFPERTPENQPKVESCNSIKDRVPAGAYVIYGG